MFRIIKALNNNSILVLSNETKREYILMGSGIGFGKMPGQQIESIKGAKVYSLVTRKKKQSALKAVNSIDPVYLEISGKTCSFLILSPRISRCSFPENFRWL